MRISDWSSDVCSSDLEALRWRRVGGASGLLGAMRDPALARALQAMHQDVPAPWTVARPASVAGMSRSAFAARFGAALGCGPIESLARWRMAEIGRAACKERAGSTGSSGWAEDSVTQKKDTHS